MSLSVIVHFLDGECAFKIGSASQLIGSRQISAGSPAVDCLLISCGAIVYCGFILLVLFYCEILC